MLALFEVANDRPDGPSWSPYLAIGMFIIAMIFVGIMYAKRRR
ncbi:hypothetical protein [Streptomyces glaucescens]|uniref:Putative membrane protein n=1 Tax=Streptomyces glaucescens TaxID=1907 RepID=A0A089Z955_STRGA|nr:hypothetical protein [Streptomyces glaucescens]AIS02311.1 putative membrane protein [Streptomyces glaucescens]